MIRFMFYFNSTNLVYSPTTGSFISRSSREHIPSLDGYRSDDELTLAYEGEFDDAAFPEINEKTGKQICEKLFQKFNAPWERPNEYAGPSMSIGDVVILLCGNGAVLSFACELMGFRSIPHPPDRAISENRPTQWVRKPEKMVEYLKAKEEDGYTLTAGESAIVYGE